MERMGTKLDRVSSTEIATRDKAVDYESFIGYLPNPDPILRSTGNEQVVYESLMTDAHLSAALGTRIDNVQRFKWEIEQGDATSRQMEAVELQFSFFDMHEKIGEIMNAIPFGMRPMESLWSKELLKETGLIMASDLVGKPANWFVFDELNQLKFKSQTSIEGDLVPPKKFLLPRNKPTYRNPYGVAELSKCYWPVIFKKGNAKFWI